jgi:hypothetical protein
MLITSGDEMFTMLEHLHEFDFEVRVHLASMSRCKFEARESGASRMSEQIVSCGADDIPPAWSSTFPILGADL